ncbi:MAG: HIT domain-containing protein [Victivallaceae bacterium]
MTDCIFCRIIGGEIPSTKVYEDDLVYAFMDISPINYGHILVVPKEHHESIATVPEAVAGRMMRVGSRLGVAMKRALDYDGYNLHLADGAAAGQVVMHVHLHVVPRGVEDGFFWNWRQLKYDVAPGGNAAQYADKIASKLKLD